MSERPTVTEPVSEPAPKPVAGTAAASASARLASSASVEWVPIESMQVPAVGQRSKLDQGWVNEIAGNLDIEQLGNPTVSERDGVFYILDGWHRIEALKQVGFGQDKVPCRVYRGLSETQQAEWFLRLNATKQVNAFDKFVCAVQAGRAVEVEIDRTVRAAGLRISQDRSQGAISAVQALRKTHHTAGVDVLARTLRLVRDAYGDAGLIAPVLEGVGKLCQRYGDQLDDTLAVARLGAVHGGVNGLLHKAEHLRRQTGSQKAHCIAGAAVDIINARRGGRKLPSWWKTDTTRAA